MGKISRSKIEVSSELYSEWCLPKFKSMPDLKKYKVSNMRSIVNKMVVVALAVILTSSVSIAADKKGKLQSSPFGEGVYDVSLFLSDFNSDLNCSPLDSTSFSFYLGSDKRMYPVLNTKIVKAREAKNGRTLRAKFRSQMLAFIDGLKRISIEATNSKNEFNVKLTVTDKVSGCKASYVGMASLLSK
jgi:hypothetical protein